MNIIFAKELTPFLVMKTFGPFRMAYRKDISYGGLWANHSRS